MTETLALGRSRRSTAGNRMRELLEKAHQEDDDDIFHEVEDDEEFAAPQETRDVFLEDFADTDEEVEVDEEEQERLMRREERRKAKGKSKAIYNPHIPTIKRPSAPAIPGSLSSPTNAIASSSQFALLDPTLDPDSMAPSTLVLALRKQRREAKRAGRSEMRRSNLRASTLRTEEDILAKEREAKANPSNKGRKALHEGGEVRGVRAMTQDELIAAAFEEEERNKESLRDWLRREEERRELRRVGRKRVKGPRWTWVSRTVGKAVEMIQEVEPDLGEKLEDPASASIETTTGETVKITSVPPTQPDPAIPSVQSSTTDPTANPVPPPITPLVPSPIPPPTSDLPYTRNYLILSQIPGGLPAEFSLILGSHTDWSSAKHVPARNRPLTRRPPLCPFTGLPAKYRHPATGVQYANIEGYKLIEELLREEYVWNDEAGWMGREDEVCEDVEGWADAVSGGWAGGKRMQEEGAEDIEVEDERMQDMVEVVIPSPAKKRGRKRKSEI